MRLSLVLFVFVTILSGCQDSPSFGQDKKPIVSQSSIADIACGPCALFNWMSRGGDDLQGILNSVGNEKTPKETVQYIIETYGKRKSATRPSVDRYGTHNGGVGSVNLMLMARELLDDHLEEPPALRGEYLQRLEDESSKEHFERIVSWFSNSIDSGFPVLFYLRCYHRTSDGKTPRMVFGHHVVITEIDAEAEETNAGIHRIGIKFADSGSGRIEKAYLSIVKQEFTAPTFTYRFEDRRAVTTEVVQTGLPLLEIRVRSYESANPPGTRIITAHFATFAHDGE